MFDPSRWALAFAELCGTEDIAEGFEVFRVFSDSFGKSGTAALTGLSGTGAARRVEAALRAALAETGLASKTGRTGGGIARGMAGRGVEIALRFFCLMVKKGHFRYRAALLAELEKSLDHAQGILRARLETAQDTGGDSAFEETLTEKLREKTGAKKIVLSRKTDPGLLGGFRLYTGTDVYDASLREMLRNMERALDGFANPAGYASQG